MDNITRRQNEMAYIADSACCGQVLEARKKYWKYNNTEPWLVDELAAQIRAIFGSTGKSCTVIPPFHCDYGFNTHVGENFYANYNLTVLDVARVDIGDNVFIAPNVTISTAGHPIHPQARNTAYEYGVAISIGSDCWIGAGVTVCPGVHIGRGTVIGAGSVVTRDIPKGVVAAGNPCRVIRAITDEDKQYYFKRRKFDEDAMRAVESYGQEGI